MPWGGVGRDAGRAPPVLADLRPRGAAEAPVLAELRPWGGVGPDRVRSVIDLRLVREDPETVRASQRARGESEPRSTSCCAPTRRAGRRSQRFEALRAEQKQLAKQMPKAPGEERPALLARTKDWPPR